VQPGGFEGLSVAREIVENDDLPAAKCGQLCDFTAGVQPGCPSHPGHLPQREHGFSGVTNIIESHSQLHVPLEALPSLPS
jgi:hypothetical protein